MLGLFIGFTHSAYTTISVFFFSINSISPSHTGRGRWCHPEPDRSSVPFWIPARRIDEPSSHWATAHGHTSHFRFKMVRNQVWPVRLLMPLSASFLLTLLHVLRCHVPVSGEAVLGMAAATGELQLYTLSDSQVRNVASEQSQPVTSNILVKELHQNRLLDFNIVFWRLSLFWMDKCLTTYYCPIKHLTQCQQHLNIISLHSCTMLL